MAIRICYNSFDGLSDTSSNIEAVGTNCKKGVVNSCQLICSGIPAIPDPDGVVVPLPPDGVVVVDPAVQLAGPLVQLEQLFMLSQLSMRLQIPLVESKVKSEQVLMPLHAV